MLGIILHAPATPIGYIGAERDWIEAVRTVKTHMRQKVEKVDCQGRLFALVCATSALTVFTVRAATMPLDAKPETSAIADSPVPVFTKTAETLPPPAAPETPREFFNAGTRQLRAGKLREAEAFLESALASQKEDLESPALYNLGHVRFGQGLEELKKSPPAGPTVARGRAAAQKADEAIRAAEAALASDDVQRMVAAYLHGRGIRKELKDATVAVERALAMHRSALNRWERASGDFKGAVEVRNSDADAEHNADVVDRCIARLVDSLREMQQCQNGMGDKSRELGEELQKLKGRIPAPNMPPGAAGDEDEEDDFPMGPKRGEKEGPTKEGEQMALSPEQAGWLLEGFKLDSDRRLPMGQRETGQPKDRSRPTW